jgi:phosphomannomutase/phosphoglucomutase
MTLASLFKKYDIRGRASGDGAVLTPEVAYDVGRAFGTTLQRTYELGRVVVGRDNRHSSYALQESLMHGLLRVGCHVVDIGMVSTPMVYWHAVNEGNIGGVMVTGSHLAPHYNGFKLSVGAVNVYGDALQGVRATLEAGNYAFGTGNLTVNQAAYAQFVNDVVARLRLPKQFKVVIDAGNGTAGIFAKRILEKLGQKVIGLYLEPNGDYPNHAPNPQEEDTLTDLKAKVLEVGADVGFAFDGDADRVGVVDERGRVIPADRLLALLSQDLLARHPGAGVVGEVLCSQVLFDAIAQAGGVPHLAPSGHSVVKDKMREVGALLGGEMSGHIFLAEDYHGSDDAFLVMGRVLELMARQDVPLSTLDDRLPRLYSTPEYRPHCPDADKATVLDGMARALAGAGDISTLDGVRVQFANGWGIVRASNTEPVLSLRFEGKTEADAQAIKARFLQALSHYPQVGRVE